MREPSLVRRTFRLAIALPIGFAVLALALAMADFVLGTQPFASIVLEHAALLSLWAAVCGICFVSLVALDFVCELVKKMSGKTDRG